MKKIETDIFGLPIMKGNSPVARGEPAPVTIYHDVERGDGVTKVDDDYQHARDIIRDALAVSSKALSEAAEEASRSGSANSFVSVAQISKSVIDGAEKLLGLSKIHKDVKGVVENNVTNNNLIVGSTAELLKMLKEKKQNAGE